MNASLYLVPTPIGNLKDITLRALEVLQEASLILAEDTRTSGKLLKHYDIATPMRSYHMHNEHKATAAIVAQMQAGQTVAMISDAGTPGISDPGFLLVREALAAGLQVECLPGATALIPALAASGLPCERFVFEGFLPVKKGRATRLDSLKEESRTMVFYESPHKLLKTLTQFEELFGGDRKAAAARELTKLHEEIVRGSLSEIKRHFETKAPKGEFVLVVAGAS
ncbi:16S rRNA (cytidine(1402)-2'-O)-methyltransferase [Gilvibacter sediminis]|uniref:16S rRNA (cytidine(1402)-2'-O)-methyltransferase n=1 Tax=Gilvibacter sediminis TaxID=379071 RepID=UPI00235051C5|nr:16S rRNA (cytidine(1402)-2'-O)-methyltransferase [Gilvibacter sediminis]MDC7996868.1 16S rRNA (cytidine(1402)-2'-O)-methyltransferase [Gilvibacter sediminis]